MTATDGGDDFQHWPDEDGFLEQSAVATPGYDSHNGLRYHSYIPAGQEPGQSVYKSRWIKCRYTHVLACRDISAARGAESPAAVAADAMLTPTTSDDDLPTDAVLIRPAGSNGLSCSSILRQRPAGYATAHSELPGLPANPEASPMCRITPSRHIQP